MITDIIYNKFVYIPIIIWFCIQSTKVIVDLIKNKKFNFKRVFGAGGMPSSHSAIVCSLSVLVGKEYGFGSGIFAISLIFAFVVMYDAAGIRRAAGKQATLLNKIIETTAGYGLLQSVGRHFVTALFMISQEGKFR